MWKMRFCQIYFLKVGRLILLTSFVCSIILNCGCSTTQQGHDIPIDSSASLSPSTSFQLSPPEIYRFKPGKVMYEVEIRQVFQHKYTHLRNPEHMILLCSVVQEFYPTHSHDDLLEDFQEDDNLIVLWIDFTRFKSSETAFKDLFSSSESLIVYGKEMEKRYLSPSSTEGQQWLSEENQNGIEILTTTIFGPPQEYLDIPPSVQLYDLDDGAILPLIDGRFAGTQLEDALYLSNAFLPFDLDGTYFTDGCTAEELRSAVNNLIN